MFEETTSEAVGIRRYGMGSELRTDSPSNWASGLLSPKTECRVRHSFRLIAESNARFLVQLTGATHTGAAFTVVVEC